MQVASFRFCVGIIPASWNHHGAPGGSHRGSPGRYRTRPRAGAFRGRHTVRYGPNNFDPTRVRVVSHTSGSLASVVRARDWHFGFHEQEYTASDSGLITLTVLLRLVLLFLFPTIPPFCSNCLLRGAFGHLLRAGNVPRVLLSPLGFWTTASTRTNWLG